MDKALFSVMLVVIQLKKVKSWNWTELGLELRKRPLAFALYQKYVRWEAKQQLLALFQQNDDYFQQTLYYLNKSKETSVSNLVYRNDAHFWVIGGHIS